MSSPFAVSLAVQAHPARTLAANRLAAEIGGDVVWDPDPQGHPPSPWRTFRHLLETTPSDATHRLQIQDDAIVCPGFADAVRAAVAARPEKLLVFYVGRIPRQHSTAVLEACHRDLPWARLDGGGWCPVVSTCWPVPLIARLLEFYDAKKWPRSWVADDEIVGRFLKSIAHVPLATVPSLVEHPDDAASLKSFARGGDGHRRAACYIGDCGECVAGIDWTLGPT